MHAGDGVVCHNETSVSSERTAAGLRMKGIASAQTLSMLYLFLQSRTCFCSLKPLLWLPLTRHHRP